jgi:hypothetical protein
MKVEEGLFGKRKETSGRKEGEQEKVMRKLNMIKVHYIHV